ncbi:hypothetical protein BZA05DRAFT_274782 [Tricharina praecox]|uniref:uncharacterized protein n=1 Tax=Tricharina praecox TaxID=43433 RepID=UPI00222029DA|nr:uncharacterized protein BZA05DRAFT_274782 [Tricharina praecox]KAI5853930.1 hypothetical protein BZA05DRAFT_274782 [Tricharina praecox]
MRTHHHKVHHGVVLLSASQLRLSIKVQGQSTKQFRCIQREETVWFPRIPPAQTPLQSAPRPITSERDHISEVKKTTPLLLPAVRHLSTYPTMEQRSRIVQKRRQMGRYIKADRFLKPCAIQHIPRITGHPHAIHLEFCAAARRGTWGAFNPAVYMHVRSPHLSLNPAFIRAGSRRDKREKKASSICTSKACLVSRYLLCPGRPCSLAPPATVRAAELPLRHINIRSISVTNGQNPETKCRTFMHTGQDMSTVVPRHSGSRHNLCNEGETSSSLSRSRI